jgi:hypothetical protein
MGAQIASVSRPKAEGGTSEGRMNIWTAYLTALAVYALAIAYLLML